MSQNISIKSVKLGEIPLLRNVAVQTFKETYKALNEPEPFNAYLEKNFSKDQILKQFGIQESSFFFVRCEGEIAGYLKLNTGASQTDSPLSKAMEIERIYVLQHFKGRRLGKALIQKSIEKALCTKLDWLWLGIWDQNAQAIGFYQSQGFEIFSDHKFMMGDLAQNDFLMRRRIMSDN
jgi:ribosomal protein S18 acetylase RimI-like enzyme